MRAFRSVGGTPYFVARADGAYVWDVEGRRLIDLVQSYGAIILGHAHPQGRRGRAAAAAADGTSYGAPTAREMKLAGGHHRAGAVAASRCASSTAAPRRR